MAIDYNAQAKSLYTGILGREGDAEGTDYWTNQLASGKSLSDVTGAFKDSARTVEDNYLKTGQSLYSSFLDQDVKAGATPGTFTGTAKYDARNGLEGNVFNALYGGDGEKLTAQQDADLQAQRDATRDRVFGTNSAGQTQQERLATAAANRKAEAEAARAAEAANRPAPQMSVAPTQSPTQWNVDPNQTVARQLEEILKGDGPLMQRARTRAMQQANASGLQNSTMAATAGEAALYDSAFPIASQDASTYARSGEFNAGQANDFARDFNAFQRSKEQANFNVTANDWAAAQEFGRTIIRDNNNNQFMLTRDGKLHAYDLERDTAQNAFTLGRDDRNNAFTLGRDATQQGYQVARDATQNEFTLGRDATGNAAQLERDRINNEAQLERDRLNIDATTGRDDEQTTARERDAASTNINNARTNYASQLASISANPNMSEPLKTQALQDLKTTYNTIIRENAKLLGWDADSWMIGDDSVPPANVVDAVTQPAGGGSGWSPQGDGL